MITLRTLITTVVIAISLSFMTGQAATETDTDSTEANSDTAVVRQTQAIDFAKGQVYLDNGSVKMKFSDGSLSWQISVLHAGKDVVTNNIEIDLIDKDGFVKETLHSFCMESKPFSLTLFRGLNRLHSDVMEIKILIVKTKSMGKDFCNGYGVDKGELQIAGEDIVEWIKTAAISEYLTLTTSN